MPPETQEPKDRVIQRLGVIGDVHAEDVTLAAAISFLQSQPELDVLLCTGDIPGDSGNVDRCCALLNEAEVQTVRGNHDRWNFENVPYRTNDYPEANAFLASLPPTREFTTPDGLLLLCHGLGTDDMSGIYPGDTDAALQRNHHLHALVGEARYRYVVNGHTHQPMVRMIHDLTFINAGTLLWAFQPCCAVADFVARTVRFFAIDPETRKITTAHTVTLPTRTEKGI